jgi:4-hydroxy-tetrahydrodipicolinate synthase
MFASPIDVPTLQRLAELERIVGIKDSSGDVAGMMRMIAAVRPVRPDFCFLTGWDAVLVPMLLAGADGGTNATSGVVPELTRMLFQQARAGQYAAAMPLQNRLLELFDAMLYSTDFPDGFRAAIELRGFAMGRSRQPLSAPQQVHREKLQNTLRCLMTDFGVEPPPEGCPTKPGGVTDGPVNAIVTQVVRELRHKGVM